MLNCDTSLLTELINGLTKPHPEKKPIDLPAGQQWQRPFCGCCHEMPCVLPAEQEILTPHIELQMEKKGWRNGQLFTGFPGLGTTTFSLHGLYT